MEEDTSNPQRGNPNKVQGSANRQAAGLDTVPHEYQGVNIRAWPQSVWSYLFSCTTIILMSTAQLLMVILTQLLFSIMIHLLVVSIRLFPVAFSFLPPATAIPT